MNSHPAMGLTTPKGTAAGFFEGSRSAPLPISGALPSSGAINPPTPSDLPPHFFYLAIRNPSPIVDAPGLSKGATTLATPRLVAPPSPAMDEPSPNPGTPGFSEGGQARHDTQTPSAPLVSNPAVRKATPPLFPPGLFRPATITTTPSHHSLDSSKGARSKATPILRPPPLSPQPTTKRHPCNVRWAFLGTACSSTPMRLPSHLLTRPLIARHPSVPRRVLSQGTTQATTPTTGSSPPSHPASRPPTPIVETPGTFLEAVITPTSGPSAPPGFSTNHRK